MPKMSFGIGHQKCPNELWKHRKEYFRAMQGSGKSKNNFADVPRWPSLGHARFGSAGTAKNRWKCLKSVVFGTCSKNRVQNRRQNCQHAKASRSRKCAKMHAFRNVFVEARPKKSGSEPLRPQNERVEAAPKLRKCRKRASRAPNWAQGLRPNLKKRVKTCGLRNLFEKANKKKQMLAWSENYENPW